MSSHGSRCSMLFLELRFLSLRPLRSSSGIRLHFWRRRGARSGALRARGELTCVCVYRSRIAIYFWSADTDADDNGTSHQNTAFNETSFSVATRIIPLAQNTPRAASDSLRLSLSARPLFGTPISTIPPLKSRRYISIMLNIAAERTEAHISIEAIFYLGKREEEKVEGK